MVECFIINEFLGGNTKQSTRFLYFNIIQASIDYFIEMETAPQPINKTTEGTLMTLSTD